MADSERFSVFSLFTVVNRQVTSQALVGGWMLSFFGTVTVDLTEIAVKDIPAKIRVIQFFGSVTLMLPADQVIERHITQISGSVGDRRSSRPKLHIGKIPHIQLSGVVVLGHLDITT
jgi:hypothetical protein